MTEKWLARAHAGAGAEGERHKRHLRHAVDDLVPARRFGDVGTRILFEALDRAAATCAVNHLDERHTVFGGHPDGLDHFLPDRGVRRATAHGEIIGEDDSGITIERGAARDGGGGGESLQFVVRAIGGLAGDLADFMEAAGIDKEGDALTHCQLAAPALAFDRLFAAHLFRQALAPAEFLNRFFPTHAFINRR